MAGLRLYVANVAYTPTPSTLSLLEKQLLGIDSQGFVRHSRAFNDPASQALILHAREEGNRIEWLPEYSFLLPAFVDTHLHAAQYLYAGTGYGSPLMEWLPRHAFKAEARLDADEALAERVYTCLCDRLIESGTGTILLFGTIAESTNLILARCLHGAGLRGFVGKLSMHECSPDYYSEASSASSIRRARQFVRCFGECMAKMPPKAHGQTLVRPALTPRFIPTCSDETLHGLGRIAAEESTTENPLIIQSHMSESADEIAWVRSTRHERTDPVIFDAAGLLGPHSVMAHCTNLPLQDRELLLQRGTSIASCPLSNAYFSDRPFPMREAIDEGMKVGLGSDIAGGYSLDVGNSMRTAVLVSKYRNQHEQLQGLRPSPDTPSQGMNKDYSITWIESLYLATRGGAASLSPPLPERAGLIEEGAPFDAQLILTLDEDTGCGVGPLSTFADP